MIRILLLSCALPALAVIGASAQIIDFETLPGGAPTIDQQTISTEYATYGVTFTLLSRTTGEPIGFPRIAKAGAPMTAFQGCYDYDTPMPYLDFGTGFLTDGTAVEVEGDLRIDYATPVAVASGVILDIDCRVDGGPPCEQWTVTAYDAAEVPLQSVVLDALVGDSNPECVQPETGPGDSEGYGWVVDTGTQNISSIVLSYTGDATSVGLAFDRFSVAGLPDPPLAAAMSAADTICPGETVGLTVRVDGGLPPYTYLWQQETAPDVWLDLGTAASQAVGPATTTRYRVIVTDLLENTSTSDPIEVVVADDDPLCATTLLVSSYLNDRLVHYSLRSRLGYAFVPSGSGGLDGPSKAICAGGIVYATSQLNDRVLRYDGTTGEFIDTFVTAGSGGLNLPVGLDFGPDGNLYIVSNLTNSVLRYDGTTGEFIGVFVPNGSGLNSPTGMIFGPDENLYVCSFLSDKVLRFDGTTAEYLGDFVTAGSGGLDAPRGLVFGPDGNLYVAEQDNDTVRRYDGETGAFIDVFVSAGSGGLNRPNDVVFAPDGTLYVPSYDNNKLLRYAADGSFLEELPNDLLDGPNWVTVGCPPQASAVNEAPPTVLRVAVEPAVPNPFNPRTAVAFTLPQAGHVRVTVLDLAGRRIAELLDETLPRGRHTVEWNGRDAAGRSVPSGVYLVSVESGSMRGAGKMVLLR